MRYTEPATLASFKCPAQWHEVYSQCCATVTTVRIQILFFFPNGTLSLLNDNPRPLPQCLLPTLLLPVPANVTPLDTSDRRNRDWLVSLSTVSSRFIQNGLPFED